MERNSLFVIICIMVLAEVSGHKWFNNEKKSSACVLRGNETLECYIHRLSCPKNQQIKINSAFYGFLRKRHQCENYGTTMVCGARYGCDCGWSHGDCGLLYNREDNADVMRCSGQRSCNLRSPESSDSHCGRVWKKRKYDSKNLYTEIEYECIKAQRTELNIIRGQQIVLNASKDYAYTYTVSSPRRGSVLFYQTNQKQKTFLLHGHHTEAGVEYKVKGHFEFTILPNTDTFIVLTGRSSWFQSDITVSFTRYKADEHPTSTKPNQRPYPTIKPTAPKRFQPTSSSFRPKSESRMTTQAFEVKTTTEAFVMEEVTRNIEDEIIKEEKNERMRPEGSTGQYKELNEGLIGGVVGGIVALIIILLVVCLLICKRRRRKIEKHVVVDKGINNPGYEVSYINPKLQEPPPAYEDINPRYDNSRVPPVRRPTADDYDHIPDVINNQKNDVKDAEFRHLAGLNVKDLEDQNFDNVYNHLNDHK